MDSPTFFRTVDKIRAVFSGDNFCKKFEDEWKNGRKSQKTEQKSDGYPQTYVLFFSEEEVIHKRLQKHKCIKKKRQFFNRLRFVFYGAQSENEGGFL